VLANRSRIVQNRSIEEAERVRREVSAMVLVGKTELTEQIWSATGEVTGKVTGCGAVLLLTSMYQSRLSSERWPVRTIWPLR
jgi:hypothetical protein